MPSGQTDLLYMSFCQYFACTIQFFFNVKRAPEAPLMWDQSLKKGAVPGICPNTLL